MRKVQEDFRWAPFEKLEGICFEEKDFRETLDGGQAFTWRELDASPLGFAAAYEGVFRKTALRAAAATFTQEKLSCPSHIATIDATNGCM